jgi:hypothetical protein
MKDTILENLDNPVQLEILFRSDKSGFENAFNSIYTSQPPTPALDFWKARLNYKEASISLYSKKEFIWSFVLILIAGIIANIGNIKEVNAELFFSRNTSFIIIPFVAAYFLLKQNAAIHKKIIVATLIGISALFINLLPNLPISSSIQLTNIHLPIFLWCILGYAYVGEDYTNTEKRIGFLKFNGDLLVMSVIIFLACILFTVITMGLFDLIGTKIELFYMQYIAIWGIAGVPLFATYLVNNNPQIINKVTPIIAKIFTPLVFVNLTIYLITLISKGKYPHHDRNLLLIYNALLIGVLALIFFSVAEIEKNKKGYYNSVLLLGLSILTIIINGIALSAISFRIFEYGVTPNRIAVLGSNLLVFVNLLIVAKQLLKAIKNNTALTTVQESIAKYLPIYAIWVGLVAFLLPFIFSFK